VVTVIKFEGNIDANLKDILTKAKKKCASGGTVRGNLIELQGDHKFKLKKFLIDLGFPEENIIIQERMIRRSRRY
jgi:translation initiation factor 1